MPTDVRAATTRALEAAGVIAVIRLHTSDAVRHVVDALAEGGVTAVEVTMTVPGAVRLIEEIAPTLPGHILLGAGTVLDPDTADAVIAAGARFVVSPVFRPEVVERVQRASVPAIPGCFSPTEIAAAWQAGADIVKLFPATSLGPTFIRDVRGPLPHVKLMPTGGVTLDNAADWIRAGAVAVGLGTALVNPALVAEGKFTAIAANARALMSRIHDARPSA